MIAKLPSVKPVFENGVPRCPCGSHKFDVAFLLVSPNHWKLDYCFCNICDVKIEVIEELEKYVEKEKWILK